MLPAQHTHPAEVFPCGGEDRFRVAVELLFRIRHVDKRDQSEHHPLIARSEIVEHLSGFLLLLLHIIRNRRGEILVRILPPLPVGYIRLDPQQPILDFLNRLVGRDGQEVDG